MVVDEMGQARITIDNTKRVPRNGTRLRELYDYLQKNRGQWVPFFAEIRPNSRGAYYVQLRDVYGLDIQCRQIGAFPRPRREVMLAGEWRDDAYVSYREGD